MPHSSDLTGVLRCERQAQRPQAETAQILALVEEVQLLAVEHDAAAGTAVADDAEFLALAVDELHRPRAAGALAGPVADEAVLREHERHG